MMALRTKFFDGTAVQRVTGVCPHDCPDTCCWEVAVDPSQGRALEVRGLATHPLTRGVLCGKVNQYLERVYHPDRLKTPLRRSGPKGSGQFEPISWEEAIDQVAENLQRVVSEHGEQSVLPYCGAGTMGLLQGQGMSARFFHRLGASRLADTICSEAGAEGYKYTLGALVGMDPMDFAQAKLVLLWGSNTLSTNLHLWPRIKEARKRGARVVVIDPACTRTAKAADLWIPIRPGTDGALALAMMQVIIQEGLLDREFVDAHTLGFAQLARRVRRWTPSRAAGITAIPAEQIVRLAREYAGQSPAAIRINYGMQRHAGGGMAVRNICCLTALVGAWRERGGGLLLSSSGSFPFCYDTLRRPDLLAGRAPRRINMNRLGDALSGDPRRRARSHFRGRPVEPAPLPHMAGPAVKALVIYNSNPAVVTPHQGAVLRGLERQDLYTVVMEHFQTDTADYADMLLPATTQLEHWDLHKPYGHLFLALNRPAIAPIGESLPNSEVFRRLARAMGYEDPCFGQSDEEVLKEFIQAQDDPAFAGISWQRLQERGFCRLSLPEPFLPFQDGGFFTPSSKCEFYSEQMARDGYDPLPAWTPPRHLGPAPLEDQGAEGSEEGGGELSLCCITPAAHSFLNSTFANLKSSQQREQRPTLWIHPQDARRRGIGNEDLVRVWGEQGGLLLWARVTADIMEGVVLAPGLWWNKHSPEGRSINRLVFPDEADMGAGALFHDLKVQVEPAASGAPDSLPDPLRSP